MAEWLRRLVCKHKVAGSIPLCDILNICNFLWPYSDTYLVREVGEMETVQKPIRWIVHVIGKVKPCHCRFSSTVIFWTPSFSIALH